MSIQLDIRRAERADRDALRAMQEASIRRLGGSFYDEDVIEGFIAHIGTMDDVLIDDGTYFAAFIDADLVGCGGWSSRKPGYAAHLAGDAATAHANVATVRSVYVHPDWTRRGIAQRVMAQIEAAASRTGFDRVQLTATLTGIPLYRRLGYRGAEPTVLMLPGELRFVGLAMHKRLALFAAGNNPHLRTRAQPHADELEPEAA